MFLDNWQMSLEQLNILIPPWEKKVNAYPHLSFLHTHPESTTEKKKSEKQFNHILNI